MSGATSAKGPVDRVLQAAALTVVFGLMFVVSRATLAVEGPSGVVIGVGFLLLAGMLMSELLEIVGLPHLTGYLLAGIVAGPHLLHLVEHEAVERLQPVNTLALALIALAGGLELKVELLKQVAKSLAWATLIQTFLGIAFVAASFLLVARFLPFTAGIDTRGLLGVALLWGVLGITRSPSACLGILAQVRPEGPVARFALSFVMASDVVVVVMLTLGVAVARPLIDPLASMSAQDFHALGHEIVGSIALGTTVGLLFSLYLWLVGGGLLWVLIALGFGLTEGLRYLHFDPLLTFMMAGFVVANFSQQGDKLLHSIERTGRVVFVVFFATAGAHLDVALLKQLWPVSLFLAATRVLTLWSCHQLGSKLAGDDPMVRRWGWSPLISQAGLALGMAAVVERAFPSFGSGYRALAIAAVAINEMVGPVIFKMALDRAGESGKGTLEKAFHDAEGEPDPTATPAASEAS